MRKTAQIISVLFHPIFIPLYTISIIFNLNVYFSMIIHTQAKLIILGFLLVTTILLPLSTLFFMKRFGLVSSYKLEDKEERIFPYLLTGGYFILAYFTLRNLQLPAIYPILFLGSSLLIFVALGITFFWKISSHTMGMGAITGTFIGISLHSGLDLIWIILLLIFCSGLTASARLILKAHTPWQIYSGYSLGLIGFLILIQMVY